MAKKSIRATNAVADYSWNSISYRDQVDNVEVLEEAEEENEVVYSTENNGGEFSLGSPVTRLIVTGLLKYDAVNSKPFSPIASHQDKAFEKEFTTGCSVTGVASVTGNRMMGPAGRTRRFETRKRVTGPIAVTWDETPPT